MHDHMWQEDGEKLWYGIEESKDKKSWTLCLSLLSVDLQKRLTDEEGEGEEEVAYGTKKKGRRFWSPFFWKCPKSETSGTRQKEVDKQEKLRTEIVISKVLFFENKTFENALKKSARCTFVELWTIVVANNSENLERLEELASRQFQIDERKNW